KGHLERGKQNGPIKALANVFGGIGSHGGTIGAMLLFATHGGPTSAGALFVKTRNYECAPKPARESLSNPASFSGREHNLTSEPTISRPRYAIVDIARGVAISAMVAYHLCWDLS